MTGLLSVVMPTYNGERYLAPALASLLGQLGEGTELVVVDDGSTDGTVALVERLSRGTPTRVLRPGRSCYGHLQPTPPDKGDQGGKAQSLRSGRLLCAR